MTEVGDGQSQDQTRAFDVVRRLFYLRQSSEKQG